MSDNMTESFARITIDQMHGAAFTDNNGDQSAAFQLLQLSKMLTALAGRIEEKWDEELSPMGALDLYTEKDKRGAYREGTIDLPLRDANGNTVGRALICITERPD